MAQPDTATLDRSERYEELLHAAAQCFQTRGFGGTSIDTVARHLGATKGRVYHYFPSKMDLFTAVRDRGMDLMFEAIAPHYASDDGAAARLSRMACAHVRAILRHHPFMQVLMDGLQMHRYSTTTELQRDAMQRHLARRDEYEARFRDVIARGQAEGSLSLGQSPAIAIQSFLSALNGPAFWYRPRPGDTPDTIDTMARQIRDYAMRGLGVPPNAPSNTETPR